MIYIYGLFLKFVAPSRKKNLVAIMSWGHVLGSWKTMFDCFGGHDLVKGL